MNTLKKSVENQIWLRLIVIGLLLVALNIVTLEVRNVKEIIIILPIIVAAIIAIPFIGSKIYL